MRNGAGAKTVKTDLDPSGSARRVSVTVLEPKLVGKRQTRLAGLDNKIPALYAGA